MIDAIFEVIGSINGLLWGPWAFVVLVASGLLFTVWTKFSQFRVLTHGVKVTRGDYDDPTDPGAINHFQALSAALSATVGLGNIGGVALAIGIGGPGSLVWMWIIGFLGMALKTVEITLALMYRNTDDPDNPSGGAMWVIDKTLGQKKGGLKFLGKALAIFFCCTLMMSSMTGGNMFQSWNVADLTNLYFGLPQIGTGIILAVLVGGVIIGGIKRIGSVAGKLVPVMCALYVLAALAVVILNIGEIPAMFMLIFKSAFGETDALGAFLGGTAGTAFTVGVQRALFSNEAGQGSAPIAHAAAKTSEPSREGIVGGLGPFIDTILICTLTALVIISTGTWNREPIGSLDGAVAFETIEKVDEETGEKSDALVVKAPTDIAALPPGSSSEAWHSGSQIFFMVDAADTEQQHLYTASSEALEEAGLPPDAVTKLEARLGELMNPVTEWETLVTGGVLTVAQREALEGSGFVLARKRDRIMGRLATLEGSDKTVIEWGDPPTAAAWLMNEAKEPDTRVYRDYKGATLTSRAFDVAFPGLGKWLVTLAAWLFAISTMISWSYYGEQGAVYIFGKKSVIPYKLVFLLCTIIGPVIVTTDAQLGDLADFGTGFMLWANIPIVLSMGYLAVRDLDKYWKRLANGEFKTRKEIEAALAARGRGGVSTSGDSDSEDIDKSG